MDTLRNMPSAPNKKGPFRSFFIWLYTLEGFELGASKLKFACSQKAKNSPVDYFAGGLREANPAKCTKKCCRLFYSIFYSICFIFLQATTLGQIQRLKFQLNKGFHLHLFHIRGEIFYLF